MDEGDIFEFVDVEFEFRDDVSKLGKKVRNKRVYRDAGSLERFREWMEFIGRQVNVALIPSTWVPDFVGVSRAAVHKRINAGNLTCFTFEIVEEERNHFGNLERTNGRKVTFCALRECQAWLRIRIIEER